MQLVPAVIAFTDATGTGAIREAFRLVRGHRLPVIGALILGGTLAGMTVVACCVGVVAGMAFYQLVITGLYLALSRRRG